MDILIYVITGILVICCILLTVVVLIQRPRSEGLGTAFGGGMTESMFGAGTSDVLTKITIWMAGAFFLCTLLLAILLSHRSDAQPSVLESAINPVAAEVEEAVETIESVETETTEPPVKIETPAPAAETESAPAENSASAPAKAE
jgi:preprotein translocase subunit SecG